MVHRKDAGKNAPDSKDAVRPFRQKPPDLSIIIVSYNVAAYLRQCLESVSRIQDSFSYDIHVVDNASGDGTCDMLRKKFPHVRLTALPYNAGFAKANNLALRQAQGRVMLLLNPDTHFVAGRLRGMLDYFDRNPGVGALGCKILNPDLTLQPSCYRFPTLGSIFGMFFFGSRFFDPFLHLDENTVHDVDFVRGAFLALRREALEEAGFLDEAFFMFGEETDLCFRMRKAGWRVVYHPETVIVHYKGKSTEQLPGNMLPQRMRSTLLFFRKHHGPLSNVLLRMIISAGIGARIVLKGILDRKKQKPLPLSVQREVLKLSLGNIK